MNIRKAKIEDAKEIHELTIKALFDDKNHEEKGFLKGQLSEKEYKSKIKEVEHFYIAIRKDAIVGFIWCIDSIEYKKTSEDTYGLIKDNDFYFIKQILSKDKEYVGKDLYDYLKGSISKDLYAAIYTNPSNTRSFNFHKKENFVITEYIHKNEKTLVMTKYSFKKSN